MAYSKKETLDALQHPRAGDLYSEMCVFWMYVVAVRDGIVATAEAAAPCKFPDNALVKMRTVDKFVTDMCHVIRGSRVPRVRLYERDVDVSWVTDPPHIDVAKPPHIERRWMDKKTEPQIGDRVPLCERGINITKVFREELGAASAAFHEASRQLRDTQKRYWDSIWELYPELDGFILALDPDVDELVVSSREFGQRDSAG